MKRVLDVFLSSLALLVLSPVMLVIAVMIRMDSPGAGVLSGGSDWTQGKDVYVPEVPHDGGECGHAEGRSRAQE
jgi:hypothetical protein